MLWFKYFYVSHVKAMFLTAGEESENLSILGRDPKVLWLSFCKGETEAQRR